jgi:hypothetical protein
MKIHGASAGLLGRFRLGSCPVSAAPERRRGFGERDRHFRALARPFSEAHDAAGLFMARQRIHQPEFLAEIYFARKNQQRAVRIYHQRIRLFVERLVALPASIHEYGNVQRNALSAAPLELNFVSSALAGGAFRLRALHCVINPAHVFVVSEAGGWVADQYVSAINNLFGLGTSVAGA